MTLDKKQLERSKRLFKTYGLSLEQWNEMSKNGCWICGRKEGRLNVDHRHVSKYKDLSANEKLKEVRGCLCFMCNVMISKLERRKTARFLLSRVNEYFKKYKMFGD